MTGPTPDFWQSRFDQNATPWDRGAPNPQLERWIRGGALRPEAGRQPRASGSDDPRVARVLVPGCGAGHEVAVLAEWGFDVTALDFVPAAIERTREGLAALMRSGRAGHVLRAELVQSDVFDYRPAARFDAIYEQTCLCALHPDAWRGYADLLHDWLAPGGALFALFMQMPRPGAAGGRIEGPPYHCDINAMRALFPATHWEWPRPPYPPVAHPMGAAELPVILRRLDAPAASG
ncbi:MAG: methyltransferase domain-containing protein [Lautropia sp.]